VEGHGGIEKLLLEGYFPDLRRLTFRLKPFLFLWYRDAFSKLLDHIGPSNAPSEGRLHKLLVVDPFRGPEFNDMWNSEVGDQLKTMNISLREDGFEFL
jgi:hypothetical protein